MKKIYLFALTQLFFLSQCDDVSVFFAPASVNLNIARIDHLRSLNLDFTGKTIFETGCGAIGDFTKYLFDQRGKITLNDAREENIISLINNIGINLPFNTYDLNKDIPLFEKFDIIFSYGTLYHLHDPKNAIKNLSNLCKEFFILSTQTNNLDNEELFFVQEYGQDQSVTNIGCRPGYKWIINELKKYFKYVYITSTNPNHFDYISGFRKIFIGSHLEINNTDLILV